ncbi:hypothetical protein C8P63_14613 [Melghirimyces profundicolus]|uniref:Uncharacterized protein n=1 Tax=Melghirimyces profundicolus TaxID=1242148 RepID=A0A2T6AWV7_9BACL|nr:hypothetical protein [Melghirimyces profundicolus]PTX48304.1 hypothetical protein C8P63_14613 [Melghirimyces profundicolus]
MNVKALERGNKLWEGHRMMLPEHEVQLQEERKRKEEYRPPELAPDALEEIGRMLEGSKMGMGSRQHFVKLLAGPQILHVSRTSPLFPCR